MKTNSRLTRSVVGLLELGWWATAVLLVAAVGFLLLTPWVNPPEIEIGLAAPVSFTANTEVRAVGDEAIDAYIRCAGASIYFSPRSPAIAARGVAVVVAILAFALFVLTQLRAVFRTVGSGQPFVPANAARIRRIGWAVIGGSLAWTAIAYFGSRYAVAHFAADAGRLDTRLDVNAAAVVGGLIILAIGEVFREGTRLDEDQSMTI